MAEESDNGQEKTEQPTPKKLRDAKKKGQVPRSKELNSMTVTVFGAIGLLFMGAHMISGVSAFMIRGFTLTRDEVFAERTVVERLDVTVADALGAISPFLLLMTVVAIFTPLIIGGWAFSLEAMAFKTDRINPINGLKRMSPPNSHDRDTGAFLHQEYGRP